MAVRIIHGECRTALRTLPDESVNTVITSPPYWGLRTYRTEPAIWGGLPECDHSWADEVRLTGRGSGFQGKNGERALRAMPEQRETIRERGAFCAECGAWRGELGLEPTYQFYVDHVLEVFREVRRVLRDDGTLWLNLGDSYHNGDKGGYAKDRLKAEDSLQRSNLGANFIGAPNRQPQLGLKPKDLCGIPWRVAFALQADGWYLRQDIIWCLSGGAWLYARTAAGCVGPMMLKDLTRLKPGTVELWTGERWSRVVSWTQTEGRGGAREIVLRSGERIGCTDGHVWPTQRGDVRTADLRCGDVLLTTRLPTGGREAAWLTADAFWFAGLYLAEGSRSGTTIQIAGHIKEEVRLARLRELVRHYGGSVRAYNHRGKAQNIHIDSPALSAVLQTLIAGHTAKDKHLTQGAWEYRDWALKEMATGYLDGDGHYDAKNERWRLGFCRNYGLERDLRALAARLGATITLNPGVSKNQSGKQFPSFKGEWRWISGEHGNSKRRSEILEVRNSRARQFWDVEIADHPHLFALASGVLTHNSKPNPMPESVTDRCTRAHEYLFLLAKNGDLSLLWRHKLTGQWVYEQPAPDYLWRNRKTFEESREPRAGDDWYRVNLWIGFDYFYDQESISEPCSPNTHARLSQDVQAQIGSARANGGARPNGNMKAVAPAFRQPTGWDTDVTGERHGSFHKEGRRKRAAAGSGIKNNDSMDAALAIMPDRRNKRSVWTVTTQPFSEAHFATFPPALVEPCILAGCPEGGAVLDPFFGSGTVGLVADRLKRNCIGVDLNQEYVAMAERRIRGDASLLSEVAVT